jgi:hypothetical protein
MTNVKGKSMNTKDTPLIVGRVANEMDREEAIDMLAYFWEEKGDMERWCDFDRDYLAREFPVVLKAWEDYKISRLVLGAVVRDLKRA